MNKELTPLEAAKELKDEVVANYYQDQNWFDERYEIIETALTDFEWLKHKLNLTFLNSLNSPEDKMRVMKIMGVEYDETYTK